MKKKSLKQLKVPILLAALGGCAGFFAAQSGLNAAATTPFPIVIAIAILFIPSFFLVIAMHEGGHALAGMLVNFDFRLYVVGPFLWEKELEGWKFKWNRNINTSGGLVICLPTDSKNIRQRFAFYAAGGPVGSLTAAAVVWSVYKFLSLMTTPPMTLQVISEVCWIMFLLSLLIFLLTALPFHANGFSSDGARVLRLYRGGDVAQFEVLLLKAVSVSSSGVRPSQWNRDELKEALLLANKINAPMGIYLHYFLYHYAFDIGELDQAELHLTDYILGEEAIPEGFRSAVSLEAAFFYAFARRDLEKSKHFWNKYKPSAIIPKSSVLATEAAIGLLKNENERAKEKIKNAFQEIPNMMDRGIAKVLTERLQLMREQVNRDRERTS